MKILMAIVLVLWLQQIVAHAITRKNRMKRIRENPNSREALKWEASKWVKEAKKDARNLRKLFR